jgi:uncharacterized protein
VLAACAADVSKQVSVSLGGFRLDRKTGRYQQTVTIRNISTSPIAGPMSLVLDNLSSNATLYNKSGTTSCAAPASPYVDVNLGHANTLKAKGNASVGLEFTSPANQAISYSTRVLAGAGDR